VRAVGESPATGRAPDRLRIGGLRVELPDGQTLLENVSLSVAAGEVAVLLGGSGSGKSTFSRVLFEPESLRRDGFSVAFDELEFDPAGLGLVPQRGALFDHLDVRGNLELALRHGRAEGSAGEWLDRVGLDAGLARRGAPVGALSGGQAQRVAVARVLAGGRELLFLDEPSVGLDPHRVRLLAELIREQSQRRGVAAIVVTHDVALAADVADTLYVLDPVSRRLEQMFSDTWPGPLVGRPPDDVATEESGATGNGHSRGRWLARIDQELVDRIGGHRRASSSADATRSGESAGRSSARRRGGLGRWFATAARGFARPFAVAAQALALSPVQAIRHPGDFARVAGRVLVQTLFRPLPFYALVSSLIGYTVLYVISHVAAAGIRPDALLREIGGSHVVALAPALAAILYVAASANATNAWLGNMELTRQLLAMRALGIDDRRYLWAPAFIAIALGSIATALAFGAGMIAGGVVLCEQLGVANGFELLTGDLLDPRPERLRFAVRAGGLVWIYAWGIAADAVAKGTSRKSDADGITRAMTGGVVACTLWIVAWELASVMAVFAL